MSSRDSDGDTESRFLCPNCKSKLVVKHYIFLESAGLPERYALASGDKRPTKLECKNCKAYGITPNIFLYFYNRKTFFWSGKEWKERASLHGDMRMF